MDKRYVTFLIAFAIFCSTSAENSLPAKEILRRIVDKAKQNEEMAADVGYSQLSSIKKFQDGKISSEKIRLHRMTWIQNKPYMELLKVDGQNPSGKEKKEEAERKAKFIRALREKSKDEEEEDITWEQMYAKYDFKELPADDIARYVFSFSPKAGRLPERSRAEKVLNHVAGKLWADESFAIVRAEAKLLDNVRFGLGILGNIESFEMNFQQRQFEQITVPSYFYIHFKARIAMVKSEERKIESAYTDYFRRSPAR